MLDWNNKTIFVYENKNKNKIKSVYFIDMKWKLILWQMTHH